MFKKFARFLGQDIKYENLNNGIKVITLARHSGKNAFCRSFANELVEAFDEVTAAEDARVALIKSEVPGFFCAGADLKERKGMSEGAVELYVRWLRGCITQIDHCKVPVIACIDGYALGGGMEMACAADLRICSPRATLGLTETALGIIPGAGGIHRIQKLVPFGIAKEMALTAKKYKPEELQPWGFVNEIAEDPYAAGLAMAEKIAANGPIGVRMAKMCMNMSYGKDSGYADDITQLAYSRTVYTKDRERALEAFAKKIKPIFEGN